MCYNHEPLSLPLRHQAEGADLLDPPSDESYNGQAQYDELGPRRSGEGNLT